MNLKFRKDKANLQLKLYCYQNNIQSGEYYDAGEYLLFSRKLLRKYGYPTDQLISKPEFKGLEKQLMEDYPILKHL